MSTTTSVVITKQPVSTAGVTVIALGVYKKNPRGKPRMWSTPLFACLEDIPSCVFGWCFPCIFDCFVAFKMRECFCIGCCYPYSTVLMRSVVRERHNINGSLCRDVCTVYWCGPCAQCQTYREVENVRMGRITP
ncbi:cornifelin homolog A-like [Asterias rubens]|uniref:cornifelin homolog A-like n=1 Tax=Asterias rubens TaxID=7604 RepID=UPI0014553E58|nr:cornifelin homolog A-like [Asterias rubens]